MVINLGQAAQTAFGLFATASMPTDVQAQRQLVKIREKIRTAEDRLKETGDDATGFKIPAAVSSPAQNKDFSNICPKNISEQQRNALGTLFALKRLFSGFKHGKINADTAAYLRHSSKTAEGVLEAAKELVKKIRSNINYRGTGIIFTKEETDILKERAELLTVCHFANEAGKKRLLDNFDKYDAAFFTYAMDRGHSDVYYVKKSNDKVFIQLFDTERAEDLRKSSVERADDTDVRPFYETEAIFNIKPDKIEVVLSEEVKPTPRLKYKTPVCEMSLSDFINNVEDGSLLCAISDSIQNVDEKEFRDLYYQPGWEFGCYGVTAENVIENAFPGNLGNRLCRLARHIGFNALKNKRVIKNAGNEEVVKVDELVFIKKTHKKVSFLDRPL